MAEDGSIKNSNVRFGPPFRDLDKKELSGFSGRESYSKDAGPMDEIGPDQLPGMQKRWNNYEQLMGIRPRLSEAKATPPKKESNKKPDIPNPAEARDPFPDRETADLPHRKTELAGPNGNSSLGQSEKPASRDAPTVFVYRGKPLVIDEPLVAPPPDLIVKVPAETPKADPNTFDNQISMHPGELYLRQLARFLKKDTSI